MSKCNVQWVQKTSNSILGSVSLVLDWISTKKLMIKHDRESTKNLVVFLEDGSTLMFKGEEESFLLSLLNTEREIEVDVGFVQFTNENYRTATTFSLKSMDSLDEIRRAVDLPRIPLEAKFFEVYASNEDEDDTDLD
jgi:hypothetical protein